MKAELMVVWKAESMVVMKVGLTVASMAVLKAEMMVHLTAGSWAVSKVVK